jgi:hypothetical protein
MQCKEYHTPQKYGTVKQYRGFIKSYPLIENFSEADEEKIKKQFHGSPVITSDPFILVAKKAMLHDG